MRVGIVTHVVNFHRFANYFNETDKQELLKLNNNDNGPAPSIIAEGLIENGCFIRFFTIGPYTKFFKSDRVEIYMSKYISSPLDRKVLGPIKEAYFFRKMVRNHYSDLDVLHVHWTYGAAYGILPYTKYIPVFCTVRDWAPIIMSFSPNNGGLLWKIKYRLNEAVFSDSNVHFIANSPYTKNLIDEKIKGNAPCIYNPIESSSLKQDDKIFPKALRIVTVLSYLSRRKNANTLLAAFKRIRQVYPDSQLDLIIGMNENALKSTNSYQMWISENMLDGVSLSLNLSHEEIYQHIDASTMMIHPAIEETFGNIIVESFSRRTPVIGGAQSGAVPYLIKNNEYGYLCDVESPESISDTAIYVYQHMNEATERSKSSYNWVKNNILPKTIGMQHIIVYNEALLHCKE